MISANDTPVDLSTRLDLRFEELSRQELKDLMSQRGLKKRTHKILKFVQTVDHKKTFRYQILTLLPDSDARLPTVHSPLKTAFDFTFDRSKSLHSTEQKKFSDLSFDYKREVLDDLKPLQSLLDYGHKQESSKGHLTSTKALKGRIAKSVTQMKIARAPNHHAFSSSGQAQADQRSLFAVRHIVDLSATDPGDLSRHNSTVSSSKLIRKTASPPAPKRQKIQSFQQIKPEPLGPPARVEPEPLPEEPSDPLDEEQISLDLRKALQSDLCPKTLEFVRSTVESISRVFGVDQTVVIDLWLKCESPKLVVKKLAMDLSLT